MIDTLEQQAALVKPSAGSGRGLRVGFDGLPSVKRAREPQFQAVYFQAVYFQAVYFQAVYFQAVYRRHRPVVERSIAWLVRGRGGCATATWPLTTSGCTTGWPR